VVDSVWEQEGTYGPCWKWTFSVQHDGWMYRVTAFTSASLWSDKTRTYVEAVLGRSVDKNEEIYASDLGGESCTLEVGTRQKNGSTLNTVENVL
jgi:hypothetical protein